MEKCYSCPLYRAGLSMKLTKVITSRTGHRSYKSNAKQFCAPTFTRTSSSRGDGEQPIRSTALRSRWQSCDDITTNCFRASEFQPIRPRVGRRAVHWVMLFDMLSSQRVDRVDSLPMKEQGASFCSGQSTLSHSTGPQGADSLIWPNWAKASPDHFNL